MDPFIHPMFVHQLGLVENLTSSFKDVTPFLCCQRLQKRRAQRARSDNVAGNFAIFFFESDDGVHGSISG